MKIERKNIEQRHSKVWQELKEGFRYAAGFAPIRDVLLIFALVNLVAMPYVVLMPVLQRMCCTADPVCLDTSWAACGLGALGEPYIGIPKSVRGLIKRIPIAVTLFGSALMVFSISRFMFYPWA